MRSVLRRNSPLELTLLHVLEPAPSSNFAGIAGAPAFSEDRSVQRREEFAGTDCFDTERERRAVLESTMRTGVPSHEIVEMAKEADIDLIVIAALRLTPAGNISASEAQPNA